MKSLVFGVLVGQKKRLGHFGLWKILMRIFGNFINKIISQLIMTVICKLIDNKK